MSRMFELDRNMTAVMAEGPRQNAVSRNNSKKRWCRSLIHGALIQHYTRIRLEANSAAAESGFSLFDGLYVRWDITHVHSVCVLTAKYWCSESPTNAFYFSAVELFLWSQAALRCLISTASVLLLYVRTASRRVGSPPLEPPPRETTAGWAQLLHLRDKPSFCRWRFKPAPVNS